MTDQKEDIKPDTGAEDRGENVSLMEPLKIGDAAKNKFELLDLVVDLSGKSNGFRRSLPDGIATSLADLVRSMNCYYSNLIEGHDTHPVDIERALKGDYSKDPEKRNLQLEAEAHISVQSWIDDGHLDGRATTRDGIIDLHRLFCGKLPHELLRVSDPETGKTEIVEPGAFRKGYVQVGRHIPVSPGAIDRFLQRFESAHAGLGKTDAIISSATAHHRLLWIHPFADGNGRVTRLMSYAILREALDTGGLWSIARGLARNEKSYKSLIGNCDLPRHNDLDGRGNLSEEALAAFAAFFLKTCIDQVNFMEKLVQPERLRDRIMIWAKEEILADCLTSAPMGQISGIV